MARWFAKRWVWAALAGVSVAVGATVRADGDPPKVGTVISLNIDGKGERSFKVVKSDKQPDGTYLSELKDTKTGEVITLVDKPGDPVPPSTPGTKAPDAPKDMGPPKAKPRTNDPLTPPVSAALPDPAKDKEKEKEKRPVIGRIFGDKDKSSLPMEMPATGAPEKKPGLLGRVFGPKKPTGPAMPAATGAGAAAGSAMKPSPSAPPAVIPTPPGGVAGSTAEPPRVTPPKPIPAFPEPSKPAPAPIPVKPAPVTPPVPSIPTPLPPPSAPSIPVPLPSVPAPLPSPGLPPIPVPPGGTSSAAPIQTVVPVGYVPAGVAFDREVQPFVIALQTMEAPSGRLTAAKGLAEGRHGSTDGVKGALFQAAQLDPCAEVRAECINHLCKLGYFTPQFLGFIQTACEDRDPLVRDAAKSACAKMIRK